MKKTELAQQLRERQYQAKMVSNTLIDALSDDQIIDAYITCSHCSEKQVVEPQLSNVIVTAVDADSFIQICNQLGKSHHT